MTKICSKCEEEKEFTEFHKDKSKPDGLRPRCKICRGESSIIYYQENREKITRDSKEYNDSHKKEKALYDARYRLAIKKKLLAQGGEYYQDWIKNERELSKKYRLANPAKMAAHAAKRRAVKLERTPKWLTQEGFKKMERKYRVAKIMTNLTKVKHCVDHDIPLQGDLVSGLHIPENLQVMTVEKNLKKHNKFIPGVY